MGKDKKVSTPSKKDLAAAAAASSASASTAASTPPPKGGKVSTKNLTTSKESTPSKDVGLPGEHPALREEDRRMTFRAGKGKMVMESHFGHGMMFNQSAGADILFTRGDSKFYAHASIVCARCPELLTQLGFGQKLAAFGDKQQKIDILHLLGKFSAESSFDAVFDRMLHYVYTGELYLMEDLKIEQVIVLVYLGNSLKMPRLASIAEHLVASRTDRKNAASILATAEKTNQAVVKEQITWFILSNYEFICLEVKFGQTVGLELFQEVVVAYERFKVGDVTPPTVVPIPDDHTRVEFQKLYDTLQDAKAPKDYLMIPADSTLHLKTHGNNAHNFNVHKAIVCSKSKLLDPLLFGEATVTKSKTGTSYELTHKAIPSLCSAQAFDAFLRFAYYDEINVDPVAAISLVPFCVAFDMKELGEVCMEIIQKNYHSATCLDVLRLLDSIKKPPVWFATFEKTMHPAVVQFVLDHLTELSTLAKDVMSANNGFLLLTEMQGRLVHAGRVEAAAASASSSRDVSAAASPVVASPSNKKSPRKSKKSASRVGEVESEAKELFGEPDVAPADTAVKDVVAASTEQPVVVAEEPTSEAVQPVVESSGKKSKKSKKSSRMLSSGKKSKKSAKEDSADVVADAAPEAEAKAAPARPHDSVSESSSLSESSNIEDN